MSTVPPLTAELLRELSLPRPAANTDKNSRGTVLIAGGSPVSTGAVVLSGMAAFRAGAGKVHLVVPQPLAIAMGVGFPEAGVHGFDGGMSEGDSDPRLVSEQVVAHAGGVDAVLVGPGFTSKPLAQQLALNLLQELAGPAFVVDAMSLPGLWSHCELVRRHKGKLVITPHAGEMAQLTGASSDDIQAEPVRFAQQAASHLQCVVVLKGATTVIAQPMGATCIHEASIAGLATSGSGDVLAGLLVGLMARGASPMTAAVWSVYLHARAAERLGERMGPLGVLARELPAEIPSLMRDLSNGGVRGPET